MIIPYSNCHNLSGRSLVCSSVRSFWAPCSHAHINFFLGAVSFDDAHIIFLRAVSHAHMLFLGAVSHVHMLFPAVRARGFSHHMFAWILSGCGRISHIDKKSHMISNLPGRNLTHPYDMVVVLFVP